MPRDECIDIPGNFDIFYRISRIHGFEMTPCTGALCADGEICNVLS